MTIHEDWNIVGALNQCLHRSLRSWNDIFIDNVNHPHKQILLLPFFVDIRLKATSQRFTGNAKANPPAVICCWKHWTTKCLVCIFRDLGVAYLRLIEMSADPTFNNTRLIIHSQMWASLQQRSGRAGGELEGAFLYSTNYSVNSNPFAHRRRKNIQTLCRSS